MDVKESLIGIRKMFMCVALFFSVISIVANKEQCLNFIIFLSMATCLIVVLDGFWQQRTGFDIFSSRPLMVYSHLGINRVTASFKQAATLGLYLDFFVPLFFSVGILFAKGWKKTRGLIIFF